MLQSATFIRESLEFRPDVVDDGVLRWYNDERKTKGVKAMKYVKWRWLAVLVFSC